MEDARKPRRRSRRDLDALADGSLDGTPLSEFVSEMRSMGTDDGVAPNHALTEFVTAPSRESDMVVVSATATKERTLMITQLSALAATTLGKVAPTGGVVVAAIGGAAVVTEIQENKPIELATDADGTSSTSPFTISSTSSSTTPSSTSSSTTSSSTSSTLGDDGAITSGDPSTHEVLDAGSVTVAVEGLSVSVVSVDAKPGWVAEIETDEPGEAQVNFTAGDARVDFRAEVEDGRLRVRVRDRRTDTETESYPTGD